MIFTPKLTVFLHRIFGQKLLVLNNLFADDLKGICSGLDRSLSVHPKEYVYLIFLNACYIVLNSDNRLFFIYKIIQLNKHDTIKRNTFFQFVRGNKFYSITEDYFKLLKF